MTRILILMLGAMLTLAGCGGGSDGLEYGAPKVTVKNLSAGENVTVWVGSDSHVFSKNGSHTFDKVQNNKSYTIRVEDNDSCGILEYEGADGDRTPRVTLKNASERFTVDCGYGVPEDDGEPSAPNEPRLSLSFVGDIGKAETPIDQNNKAKVQAKLTRNGEPLSNKLLQVRVAPSDVAKLVTETHATNDNGIANITLSNGAKGGAAELIVAYVEDGQELVKQSIVISSKGGSAEEVAAEGSLGLSVQYTSGKDRIEDGHEATVEVTVTDAKGRPVNGASVAFELDRSYGDIGRLGTETAQTNNAGKASVKIFAGEKPGAGVVKAVVYHADDKSLIGLSNSKAFMTKGDEELGEDDADTHNRQMKFHDMPKSISIDKEGFETVKVKVTSLEEGNHPIVGALVRFEVEDANIGRLGVTSAVTNQQGVAETKLFAGSVEGASNLIAKTDGAKDAKIAFATKGGESIDENSANVDLTISVNPRDIKAGKDATVSVIVSSTDNDYELEGHLIRFTTEDGLGEFEGNGIAITNESGVATIKLGAGERAGGDAVIATFEDIKTGKTKFGKAPFTTEGKQTYELVLDATKGKTSGDSIKVGEPSTITATLKQAGAVASNVSAVVTFTTEVGRFEVDGRSTNTYMSNLLSGEAIAELKASDVAGAGRLTASVEVDGETYNASIVLVSAGDEVVIDEPEYTLSIRVVRDTLADPVAEDNPATLHAELKDRAGVPVSAELVTFSTTLGRLDNPANGQVQTNANGEAEVELHAGATAGAGVATVTFEKDGQTYLAEVVFTTAGDEQDVEETLPVDIKVEVNPVAIEAGDTATVTATITHAAGTAASDQVELDGQLVRFTSNLGELEGNGVVITNNGVATIALHAGDIAGAGQITATFMPLESDLTKSATANFSTEGKQTYELVITADRGTSSATAIDAANPAQLTVELKRAGQTVAGFNDVVELTTSIGRFDSEQSPVQLLLENGVGTIDLHAGFTAGAGRVTATAQVDGDVYRESIALVSAGDEERDVVEQQPTLALTLVEAGTTDAISKLSKADAAEVLIKLELNGADLVLEEQMIRFTSVIGAVLDKETVMLDENGEARVSIVPTDLAGAGTLVAVLEDDSSVTATRHFATKGDGHPGGEEPYPVTIELRIEQDGAEVSEVDNTKPATIQITLVGDADDIAHRLVTVASTVGSVAPTTVLTDGDGKASTTLNTKNIWNAGVVTATLQSNEGETLVAESKSFGIDGAVPGEVSIEIELTDNNGDPIGTPQYPITQDTPANIKVTVKQGTDEIAGELVRVSSDLGELSPASGTTITNDDGEATSLILRAGNEAGAGTLTASIMIDGVEYDGSVYFLTWGANNYDPNEPLVLELDLKGKETGDYPNSENPITDSNPATVTATLTRGGIEIPDALIRFETDLGVIDPSTGKALTDEDGIATVILQIADESGAGTITATYDKGDGLVVEKHFEMTQTKDGLQLSELELLDSNDNSGNGLIGKELSATNMAIARVRLVTDSGMPIENEIIYFHVENTHPVDGDNGDLIGIVNPRSALTDSNGYATVELTAGAAGAARLIATYNWKGTELRRSTPFMSLGDEQSPQEPDHIPELGYVADATDPENTFEKGGLELIGFGANDNIPAGSTISIGVNLVDAQNNNAPWPGIVRVQFNSLCADREDGSASIDSEVALINGRGIATYVAKDPSCEADVIYAEVNVDGKQLEAVSRQFSIDHSEASYIEFVSATPEQIGLKGSGDAGVPETATLTFQVKNADGFTVPAGTKVNFEAVNPLGGFKVDTPSAVTNNNGRVEVKVVSGHMPYSASVKATLDADDTVFGYGSIKVSTGVVTQDRFRLSLSEFNVAAWNHTEVTVDVTVSAADRMGNHSDGTDVYFTTEVGRIDDFCTIENGSCTVQWYSQGAAVDRFDASRQTRQCLANTVEAIKRGVVKPFDCWNAIDADGMGEVAWRDRFGRNTITAYAAGEESFRDVNGNNIFDEAEYDLTATADEAAWRAENRYFPLASPFRDDNETALYEEGIDEFHDFSDAGIDPDYGSMTLDSRRFRGVGCSQDARDDGHCEGLTHVRDSVSMVLGTDNVVMTVLKESDLFALSDLDIKHDEVASEDQPETARFELINGPNVGQYVDELNTSTLDAAGETVYVFVHDLNGNGLANGSKIEAEGGGVLTNVSNGCANIANNSTEPEICSITFSPGNPADSIPTIKLVGPNGVTLERTFTIQ